MAINMVGPQTPGTTGPLPATTPGGYPPGTFPAPPAPGSMLPRQARPGDRPPMGPPAAVIDRLPAWAKLIYRRPGWTPGGVPPAAAPPATDTGTPLTPEQADLLSQPTTPEQWDAMWGPNSQAAQDLAAQGGLANQVTQSLVAGATTTPALAALDQT